MTPTRMTKVFLAAAATCWVAAACDDGGSARPDASTDADATPDVDDDGDVSPEVGDLPDATDDAAGEATDDGGGASGTCADPAPLACGDNLRSETTATASSMMDEYSCATGLDQSGPERVYALTVTSSRLVTLVMTPAGAWDLDMFVLGGICEADSCAYSSFAGGGGAAEQLSFMAEPGTTFYVVVDGFEGASGAYSLEATCADAEICDNDADDNGNGLIDCEDSQCRTDAACAEACGNAEDDDGDALVDCDDPDCGDDPGCFESACGDSTDNDGDGSTDCADFECVGATECAGGAGAVGDPCAAHTDCVAGACFDERSTGWAGGYCLVYSTATDCAALSCPSGSRCVAFGTSGPWVCLDGCTSTADCRPGHACQDSDGDRAPDVCVGGCTDSAQCTATGHCTGSPATPGSCRMPPEVCDNSADDDGDTLVDCGDTDCAFHTACGVTPVALAGGNTCAAAVPIPLPAGERGATAVTGTLATANGDNRAPSCASRDSTDVAYSFTLTRAASVVADLRGGPAAPALTDSVLSISRACTEPDFQCSDDFGGVYYHSRVGGRLGPGAYYLFVDGFNGSTGTYTLGLLLSEP